MRLFRRCIATLLVCIMMLGLKLTASAEEISHSSLSNACSALETFLYPDVYQSSDKYSDYLIAFSNAKTVSMEQNATDKQISDAYYNLREAYILVMKSTYDFSGLEQIVAIESWIDPSLYEEDGLNAFLEEASKCREELNNPHLYPMENDSADEYKRMMQGKLYEIERAAVEKYNQMQLKDMKNTFSNSAVISLIRAMEDTLNSSGKSKECEEKENYKVSLEALKAAMDDPSVTNDEFQALANTAISDYRAYLRTLFDFSEPEQTCLDFERLEQANYTDSYQLVYNAYSRLSMTLSQPVFFHVPSELRGEESISYSQEHINSLDDGLEKAKEYLIETEKVNYLEKLIETNKKFVSGSDLTEDEKALAKSITKAENLLKSGSFTATELDQSIELIQITSDTVVTAIANGSRDINTIKGRGSTVKLILIFTIIVFVLSASLAVVLAYRKKGSVDFRN